MKSQLVQLFFVDLKTNTCKWSYTTYYKYTPVLYLLFNNNITSDFTLSIYWININALVHPQKASLLKDIKLFKYFIKRQFRIYRAMYLNTHYDIERRVVVTKDMGNHQDFIMSIPIGKYKQFIVSLMKKCKLDKNTALSLYKTGLKLNECKLTNDIVFQNNNEVLEKIYTKTEMKELFDDIVCTY